jgi:hypothetical protein
LASWAGRVLIGITFFHLACRPAGPIEEVAGASPFVRRALDSLGVEWQTRSTRHFRIHAPRASRPAARLAAIEREAERAQDSVLAMLGLSPESALPADLFLVERPDDLIPIVGRPAGGWTESSSSAILLVDPSGGGPPYRHELGHFYTHRLWGTPFAAWVSEGAAVFAVGGCTGLSLHNWAASLAASGMLPPLADLEKNFDYARAAPHLEAGSFMLYLSEEFGIDSVRKLFLHGLAGLYEATGRQPDALEAMWRARLAEQPGSAIDATTLRGRIACEGKPL